MSNGYKTGGRNAGTPNKSTRELRAIASQYAPEALEVIVSVMRNSENEHARIKAAQTILERAYGKPAPENISYNPQPIT